MKAMKHIVLVILAVLFLGFAACDKNKVEELGSADLTLDFKFIYGELSFHINEVYQDYPFPYEIKYENLKMYISEISLIDVDGIGHPLSEIIFIDAADSLNKFTFTVPALQYQGIAFSVGVPQSLNGTDNEDFDAALYSADHPLSLNNGMYWTWNSGYRFVLLDGRCNTTPDEDDEFETLVSIHTGKDYCYRSSTKALNWNSVEESNKEMFVFVDVHGFLSGPNELIDVAVDNQSHGTNESLANRVSDNVIISVNPW